MEMSRLTRNGIAETVSRDQILRCERGLGNIHFPCSADHEQDWQPYPVDPYSCYVCDHTYILMTLGVYTVVKTHTDTYYANTIHHVVFGRICTEFRALSPSADFKTLRCRLERTILIDYRKKHKILDYLSVMIVMGSQVCTMSEVCCSRGVQLGSLLRRTSLQIPGK